MFSKERQSKRRQSFLLPQMQCFLAKFHLEDTLEITSGTIKYIITIENPTDFT